MQKQKRIPIIELFLTIITGWWSLVLLVDDRTFEKRAELFQTFKKIMNENGWGYIFLIAFIVLVLSLVWEKQWIRKIALLLAAFLFSLISAAFILSQDPFSTGTGIYFAISILALWELREVKQSEQL